MVDDVDQWERVGLTQRHRQLGQPVTVTLALRIESEIIRGDFTVYKPNIYC